MTIFPKGFYQDPNLHFDINKTKKIKNSKTKKTRTKKKKRIKEPSDGWSGIV